VVEKRLGSGGFTATGSQQVLCFTAISNHSLMHRFET